MILYYNIVGTVVSSPTMVYTGPKYSIIIGTVYTVLVCSYIAFCCVHICMHVTFDYFTRIYMNALLQ